MSASASASAAPRAARRLAVLALYRRCLRSAARCPAYDQRQTMWLYARGRFRDARAERDPARVAHLLAEGAAELATMDSFHAVRDAKARAAGQGGQGGVEGGDGGVGAGGVSAGGAGGAGGAGYSVGGGDGSSGLGGTGGGAGGAGAGGAALREPPPLRAPPPAPSFASTPPSAAAVADAAQMLERLGAALGALDERAWAGGAAAAWRQLQAISLSVDGASAALMSARPGAAAAALREAHAAQRELQALVLALRDEASAAGARAGAGIGTAASAAARLESLAPLSLSLRRLLWALREGS